MNVFSSRSIVTFELIFEAYGDGYLKNILFEELISATYDYSGTNTHAQRMIFLVAGNGFLDRDGCVSGMRSFLLITFLCSYICLSILKSSLLKQYVYMHNVKQL